MKCNIVKDLLPLYCDKLTSQDSNEEIEKHLSECAECKSVYESMNQKEDDIKLSDKDVKPLKKMKKHIKLKIIAAILGTFAFLAVTFVFLFVGVIPISSKKLNYTVKAREIKHYSVIETDEEGYRYKTDRSNYDDGFYPIPEGGDVRTEHELWLNFTGHCSCINKRADSKYDYFVNDEGVNDMKINEHLWIYPVFKIPFEDRGKHPNEYSLHYFNVKEGDTLTIHHRDKTEIIDLWHLYLDNIDE